MLIGGTSTIRMPVMGAWVSTILFIWFVPGGWGVERLGVCGGGVGALLGPEGSAVPVCGVWVVTRRAVFCCTVWCGGRWWPVVV